MLRGPPHRWLAFVLVLALSAGSVLPAWASYVIPVPGHHFTIVAPPIDRVEYHDREGSCEACDATHPAAAGTHHDCVICFALALPVGVLEPPWLPAGFEVGRQIDSTGVSSDLDPYPPRFLSHRI
jgi:hypothetical protein